MSDSFVAVGLDVGGTKIAAGVVAFPSGEVLCKDVIMTLPKRGGEAVLSDALDLARKMIQEAACRKVSASGIGIGVAELIDPCGNVTSGQTIAWRGVPVRERFAEIAPAVVESDVRAAALAESVLGAGRSFSTFAYITVGTGISYALVQDGRPYSGARGNAILLSSGALSTRCTDCGAELRQVLEEFAAGPPLVRRYNQCSAAPKAERAEDVTAAAAANDPVAIEVVQSAGEALGNSVGFLVNLLDPEVVVVGGGLGLAGGLYWSSFVASTRKHIWADTTRDLPILPAQLGAEAGMIGAAAAVWVAETGRTQDRPPRLRKRLASGHGLRPEI
jgi:glucokinase